MQMHQSRITPLRPFSVPWWQLAAKRTTGISFGFAVQALFVFTVWHLFWFMREGASATAGHWVIRDCAFAVIFAVSHSIMLVPVSRRKLTKIIPGPFYDSVFCLVTCVSLLVLFFGWRSSETVIWELTGPLRDGVVAAFYASWAALFYSLSLTGLGWQNGWTPFWHWLKCTPPPRREFKPRGAYKLIRHPVYLSFLGIVWFTPRMTLDHAALTAIWTAYIFYGSFLKDRRLLHFIGEPYKKYSQRVAGYPLMFWGPLAKERRHHPTCQPPHAEDPSRRLPSEKLAA